MITENTTDKECYQMVRSYVVNVLREDPDKDLPVSKMAQFSEFLGETGIMNRIYSRRSE